MQGIQLSEQWKELIRMQLVEAYQETEGNDEPSEKEQERLTLKRGRILKQHREGYISDNEFELEIASVDLALQQLEEVRTSKAGGLSLDEVIALGQQLPEIASVWQSATTQEQREWVSLLVEPTGIAYDIETQNIASITARPLFAPFLRLQQTMREYQEAPGVFVSSSWRPATAHRQGLSLSGR